MSPMRHHFLYKLPAVFVVLCWGRSSLGADPARDWPMLGHDAGRSGATVDEVRPPFARKWYRLFPNEGINAGVQPIVCDGKVFIGTLHGVLHAIDAESGKDTWTFRAGAPILHAAAAGDGRVYFGAADGIVYAINSSDGSSAWKVKTGAAVWNAPALWNGRVFIGSRDGKLYCIDARGGAVVWSSPTGGPILNSPAVDPKFGRVYVGSEDMHAYAFDANTGARIWQSDKLPGVSFRGYHPVVAPDGSVMLTCLPCAGGDAIQQVVLDMVHEVFGDFASWRHNKQDNDRLRRQNFEQLAKPETYRKELEYLRKRLIEQPAYQTFFVIDSQTGRQRFVAPIVYAESMNGPAAPPVVTPQGKVIVKYSALLRSRYEHYSPFLNVGYLDTATGDITPVMDQSRTYGWHDSLLLVHDEQSQLAVGGNVLFNTHQDNVNAMDLKTLQGYRFPLVVNQHEVKGEDAAGIWATYLSGTELPVGWEWLQRGTAVYGGGSAIDTSIVIAGDSFYYLPTHEINSGAAVIAYHMNPGGKQADRAPAPTQKLSEAQWKHVPSLKWDWDTLSTPRLKGLLRALPVRVPGTADAPLREQARMAVEKIRDEQLDAIIFEPATPATPPDHVNQPALRAQLAGEVNELISTQWRPLLFPAAKAPSEAYRFFIDPSETVYTLALAYPYLPRDLKKKVADHVASIWSPKEPLGPKAYSRSQGTVRSLYDPAPESLLHVVDDAPRSDVARLYPLWLWAHVTGDWQSLEVGWPSLREVTQQPPAKDEADCGDGRAAGLIAACRMAKHFNDDEWMKRLLPLARQALRDRLVYELSYTEGGVIVPLGNRTVFGRWRHLTPEVARLINTFAPDVEPHLIDVYLDHHRPTWWLAWNVELLWRNEAPLSLPTMSLEAFQAKALIAKEPAQQLVRFLDIPWCKGDEYHIQKLALVLSGL